MQADLAMRGILNGIASGTWGPGDKLNEVAVATKLGVSRNTLREAFARMATQGLVQRIPNRGVFVTRPEPKDVKDLYAARILVESGALLWGKRQHLTGEKGLDRHVRSGEEAADKEDLRGVALANRKFHEDIVISAGSAFLKDTTNRMSAQMQLVFSLARAKEPNFQLEYVPVNRRIADLVNADEWEQAAEYLRESLAETSVRLQKLLKA